MKQRKEKGEGQGWKSEKNLYLKNGKEKRSQEER